MAQTKATKKFEKRHLKDTLERRKGRKKVTQQQQRRVTKKARRVEENGADAPAKDDNAPGRKAAQASAMDALHAMSVDEFFQGGFEIPELPVKKNRQKRKRELHDEVDVDNDDMSDDSFEQEPVPQDSESNSDVDDEDHQRQLDSLAEHDPEFHRFLQENEPELLDSHMAELQRLSDDDDEPERTKYREVQPGASDDLEDDMEGVGTNELTKTTLAKWQKALHDQHSLRTAREVILAFRAATHVSEGGAEERAFKYSISNPDVYHHLLVIALKYIPNVFQHHLPIQESKGGKVHVSTESKKFQTLAALLKSQVASLLHLLGHLSDPSTLRLTLSSTLPLLPYMLSFKKLVRAAAKAVADVWSSPSNTEATRVEAFLVLRRLTWIGDPGIRENVLKATYQCLVRGSRQTTVHSIAGINLMKNSAAELWGVDSSVAYTTGFTFIRQLAIHLRGSIQDRSKESYKQVYNWQYVHSLDFWSRVISAHCEASDSPLRPLIYPLVQVTLGALRLIPTATYFPLRFQLIRSLLRISRATATYIPLAPSLYEVLSSAEIRKAPKPSTLKPLDFTTSIRAAKSYLKTRTYQDGVGEQLQELLGEFFVLWCKNIAFPELALPVTVMLKRWLKDVNLRASGKGNQNQKVNGMVGLVVQKIEANARFIEDKRAGVGFAPNDRKGIEGFLEELQWEKTPLGAFVAAQRKMREEKARLVEVGRSKEEAERKTRERESRRSTDEVNAGVESDNDDSDSAEDGSDSGLDSERPYLADRIKTGPLG